jgi:hypothetical protein
VAVVADAAAVVDTAAVAAVDTAAAVTQVVTKRRTITIHTDFAQVVRWKGNAGAQQAPAFYLGAERDEAATRSIGREWTRINTNGNWVVVCPGISRAGKIEEDFEFQILNFNSPLLPLFLCVSRVL